MEMPNKPYPDIIGVVAFKDGTMDVYKDCVGVPPSEDYYHSSVVEALQKENVELKAKLAKTEWQPIETAPHGVWILIYAYRVVSMACWHADGYWLTFKDNRIMPIAAKHWMPLPEPPTTEETK